MEGDPISEAFERFVSELYWSESLEEAEEKLRDFIENMDEDLRELLLERRREICRDRGLVSRTGVMLSEIELSRDEFESLEDLAVKAAVVTALVNALFLVQCTPSWSTMGPGEKARILAPLYRASYALRLAAKNRDAAEPLVDEALRMALISLDRVAEAGLLDEMEEIAQA
ncbi:MAG: hypothetical protein LRS49_00485 [Desulfurococcales archaeon]|nr:hypothetical protein [Desulfurococcales archaeon]